MNKQTAIHLLSDNLKRIRNDADYTQDELAKILGLSKKTIVQIEKKRALLNWTTVIALVSLLTDNVVILALLEDSPLDIIKELSFHFDDDDYQVKSKTMGGTVFWDTFSKTSHFKLQKHHFSQFYRILDQQNYRIYSTFEKEDALATLDKLQQKEDNNYD